MKGKGMDEKQRRFNIDELRYIDYQEHTLILKGWFLGITENWKCTLTEDDAAAYGLDFIVTSRPDVAANYPEEPNALQSGCEIRLPRAWELAEKIRHCQVWMTPEDEGKPFLVWESSGRELRDILSRQLLSWHLDEARLCEDESLVISGWAVCQRGEGKLRLLKQNGREIPLEPSWKERKDVSYALALPEGFSDQIGFTFVLEKAARLQDKKLMLEYSCEYAKDVCPIMLSRMIMERSPAGRVRLALSPQNRGRNLAVIREKGLGGFYLYLQEQAGTLASDYEEWLKRNTPGRKERLRQKKTVLPEMPLFSVVVPLYRTPVKLAAALIDSVRASTYKNWELCLADGSGDDGPGRYIETHYGRDSRILYRKLDQNRGISENTNAAIEMAKGDYIVFADHDDLLTPDALFEMALAVNRSCWPDVLYSDEDKVSFDGKHFMEPNFKPDFSLFRLRENNYICHLFAVKTSLIKSLGGLRSEFDGAQDFDLALRCAEKADSFCHIPKVLYHWRSLPGSTALDPESKRYAFEAGQRAVQEHYDRLGIPARVLSTAHPGWYRSQVAVTGHPLVSIIIPTKNHAQDLRKCVESVLLRTDYPDTEIVIVDNGSTEKEIFSLYEEWKDGPFSEKIRVLQHDVPFNFSEINNYAVRQTRGEYLCFLNNDIEVLEENWIREMLMICQQDQVACVGAKLFYPDHTIQHAGVILGMGGIAGHLYCTGNGEADGYMGRLISVQDLSAVTAACMMVKRSSFDKVGGYDESLAVAFNDVDLCMKFRKEGEKVVFTPYARLIHYESKSRGLEDTPEKQRRFRQETTRFKEKWSRELEAGDPFFSPNLSLDHGYCAPRGSSLELK